MAIWVVPRCVPRETRKRAPDSADGFKGAKLVATKRERWARTVALRRVQVMLAEKQLKGSDFVSIASDADEIYEIDGLSMALIRIAPSQPFDAHFLRPRMEHFCEAPSDS